MLIGILISFCLGTFFDWNFHGVICFGITTVAGILLPFAVDTPQWLLSHGQEGKALEVLQILNAKPTSFLEFERLQNEKLVTEANSNGKCQMICNSKTLKSVGVALGVMTFQQLCGINGITFYAVTIFHQTASSWGAYLPAIVLASTQVLASLTSTQIIDRAGRKVLLISSSIITGLSSCSMGLYFYFGTTVESLFWIPLATLIIFSFGFAIGFGPVSWILVSEILPNQVRQVLNPIIMAYTWLCVFAVTKTFPLLIPPISISGVFWLYSGFSLIGLFFVIFVVPETSGKSSEELDKLFQSAILPDNFTDSKINSKV